MSLTSWAKNNKVCKYIADFAKSNVVVKFIACFIITVVEFIPIYIYLFSRWLFSPEGFWQEFALIGGWAFLFGWLQVLALIVGIVMTIMIIVDEL